MKLFMDFTLECLNAVFTVFNFPAWKLPFQ